MPCVECETRAEDRDHGNVVAQIHYKEDGETYYTCLDCLKGRYNENEQTSKTFYPYGTYNRYA